MVNRLWGSDNITFIFERESLGPNLKPFYFVQKTVTLDSMHTESKILFMLDYRFYRMVKRTGQYPLSLGRKNEASDKIIEELFFTTRQGKRKFEW